MDQTETDDKNEQKQKALLTYDGPDRVVSSVEYLALTKGRPKRPTFMTGISGLDQAIGGFRAGEIITISGPTGMGKTTLCETIVRSLCAQDRTSLFFTFEVLPEEFAERHKDPGAIVYLPLEHKSKDLFWLKDRILEAKLKYPHKFTAVFIDHLHYIIDLASRLNTPMEIGRVMRFLKQDVAIELQVPVFLVAHVGRIKFGEQLSIEHIRDSALIAAEADIVLMICRKNDLGMDGRSLPTRCLDQNLATLTIEKSRRTGAMGRQLEMYKDGHVLKEVQ